MKTTIIGLSLILALFFSVGQVKANDQTVAKQVRIIERSQITAQTAEDIFKLAGEIGATDPTLLQANIQELSFGEKVKLAKTIHTKLHEAKLAGAKPDKIVIYVLCVILPPLAVGLWTDWQMPTVWNILWTILWWVPGVVHAFIVVTR